MTVITGQHTYLLIKIIMLMNMLLTLVLDTRKAIVKCQSCPTRVKANLTFLKLSGTEI